MANPLVIIHGYSDNGASFGTWKTELGNRGIPVENINICQWISLSNEITLKDIAEGFERALSFHGITGDFDALVHSTGMLVVRSWLTGNDLRRGRLKRLIALAPATFGSPLAPPGRSILGSIFKGSKNILSPDFLAAGDLVLDALEPGSKVTWDLTHLDILGPKPFYGMDADTPYVFIFDGTDAYPGITGRFANCPGTDGTVRWAACALNTEKFTVDFRRAGAALQKDDRYRSTNTPQKGGMPIPFWPVPGVNHGTIASDPPAALIDAVRAALNVDSSESFTAWQTDQTTVFAAERTRLEAAGQLWQQFVVHARDQFGDPIRDFHIRISGVSDTGAVTAWDDGDFELHTYATDKSYRCYHVNLSKLLGSFSANSLKQLNIQVIASSGSSWVDYHGEGSEVLPDPTQMPNTSGRWDASLTTPVPGDGDPDLFFPFTTTLIELILERDAIDFGPQQAKIFQILPNA